MTDKKKKVVKIGGKPIEETAPKRLSAQDYWKLRAYAEAHAHDETKVSLCRTIENNSRLEGMVASLKIERAMRGVKEETANAKKSLDEYNEVLDEIGQSLGIKLADCTINPDTFEVMEDKRNGTG